MLGRRRVVIGSCHRRRWLDMTIHQTGPSSKLTAGCDFVEICPNLDALPGPNLASELPMRAVISRVIPLVEKGHGSGAEREDQETPGR
jgi:hypothetical protein